ncbi:MAG: TetR/AcrR family transcriptional regulator [Pseudomonadota bacterium]|jgi:AcrR family transcriptional regulator
MIAASVRSPRKPKGSGAERREEILDHALKLFSEYGVHTVTTRQIAAAVGISQPSLYAYFPTKQALVEEVSARAFQALSSRMQQVSHTLRGVRRIEALARVYIDFGLEQPDAYRVAFMLEPTRSSEPGQPDPILQAGLSAFDGLRQAVAVELGEGRTDEQIDLLAQSFWAATHGLVSLLIARPNFPWCDREALIEFHLKRLAAGF